jgi:hypothetical protein
MGFATDKLGVRKARAAGSSGTGFYIARGRPFVTMKEYRDRRRDPDARVAVKLSNELTKLANDFPRFRLALNQLTHHVLVQVRSPAWKSKAILKVLDQERPINVCEVIKRSGLDFVSVKNTLAELRNNGQVITCNRAGRPLAVDQGHKTYYRRG